MSDGSTESGDEFVRFSLTYEQSATAEELRQIFQLYKAIESLGGFHRVYENDLWDELAARLGCGSADELFALYKAQLLGHALRESGKAAVARCVQPETLDRPRVIGADEEPDWSRMDALDGYVFLLRDRRAKWGLDAALYTPEALAERHGGVRVRVIWQNPLGNSFKIRSAEMYQRSNQSTVAEYIDYQRSLARLTAGEELPAEVGFAVNVDIGRWTEIMSDLRTRVPSALFCKGEADVLGLLRQEIEGITIPQIYLKVAGCWTGGHEENLRVRAVNINTGECDVEWYCVDVKETPRLRALVRSRFGVDIYSAEGLWYSDLDFFLAHNVRVCKLVQRPGDVVVLAPGTLHWVRSLGATTNVAWNIALGALGDLRQMAERHEINRAINFKNLFPVRTLFMDALNIRAATLAPAAIEFLRECLGRWGEEEFAAQTRFRATHPTVKFQRDNPNRNNVLLCTFCNRDTLLFWATCYTAQRYSVYCLVCFDAHLRRQSRCAATHEVYKKAGKAPFARLLTDLGEEAPTVPSLAAPSFYLANEPPRVGRCAAVDQLDKRPTAEESAPAFQSLAAFELRARRYETERQRFNLRGDELLLSSDIDGIQIKKGKAVGADEESGDGIAEFEALKDIGNALEEKSAIDKCESRQICNELAESAKANITPSESDQSAKRLQFTFLAPELPSEGKRDTKALLVEIARQRRLLAQTLSARVAALETEYFDASAARRRGAELDFELRRLAEDPKSSHYLCEEPAKDAAAAARELKEHPLAYALMALQLAMLRVDGRSEAIAQCRERLVERIDGNRPENDCGNVFLRVFVAVIDASDE